LFWTTGAAQINPAPQAIQRASTILARHNLLLDICPGSTPVAPHILPFDRRIRAPANEEQEDRLALRQMAHQAHVHDGRIPVIIALCDAAIAWRGITPNGNLGGWLQFVTLNAEQQAPDGATMCHEMTHAAGNPSDWPTNPTDDYSKYRYVMINNLNDRNCLMRGDVLRYTAPCYFAEPG